MTVSKDNATGRADAAVNVPPTMAQVRRSLLLAGAGAIVGLAVAGFGLFTAKGTSTLVVPAEDVALVNQQPISRVDFIASLQSLYATDLAHATPEQKQKVLNDMIREELLVQRGKELDVASVDPDVRSAMAASVEQQTAMNAYTELPTEQKLRAFFEAHRANYASEGTMVVRDLMFAEAPAANAAVTALKAGQAVDDVLKKFNGRDTGKVKGEEFYFAAKIHLGDAVFAVARTLPDGGVSAPIAADGLHVLAMERNAPPVPIGFEAAQSRVMDDYRRDAAARLQAANNDFLRKRANILIAKDVQ
jgi:hypothetical protein